MDLDLEPDPMVEAEFRAEELAHELADVLRLPIEVAVIVDQDGKHEGSVRIRAVRPNRAHAQHSDECHSGWCWGRC